MFGTQSVGFKPSVRKPSVGEDIAVSWEANEMRVELTDPPGLFIDGALKTVPVSEADGFFPHIVLEMSASGRGPVKVTLGELDLGTIMRAARGSKVEKIRDAVRV